MELGGIGMLIDMPATLRLDRAAIEPLVREIVTDILQEQLPEALSRGRTTVQMPAYFLVSSVYPTDVLSVVEAPDVTAGERNEPHWRAVQDIHRADRIIFRDSTRKALVGIATADRMEKGIHRHAPHKQAIRWWLRDSKLFEAAISDEEFRQIFREHDEGGAGFKLFRDSGQFSQKTYTYPLGRATAEAVLARARAPITTHANAPFAPTDVIRILVTACPKKPGNKNYERWMASYKDGCTVAETIAKGATKGDIKYDLEHGFIAIERPAS
jgi:hypothetical protein